MHRRSYLKQLLLFPETADLPPQNEQMEWGTFKDSLKAPIHNWFTYPAGFSYKAVESSFAQHNIQVGQVVYDPFMGSGTTNVTAKKAGIHSYGVEAHPFVFRIAKTKLNWQIGRRQVREALYAIETKLQNQKRLANGNHHLETEFPELVLKCYEAITLRDLLFLREAIAACCFEEEVVNFLFVGLTGLLREISSVATGWPYIAPNKQKITSQGKDVWQSYVGRVWNMVRDIEIMAVEAVKSEAIHYLFNGDSRNTAVFIPTNSIDHVFTSPPYLNNFDYADRTRLELYFFGEAKTWGDITETVRDKLITSATTQITRNDPRYVLSPELQATSPEIYGFLEQSVTQLGNLRLQRGGKKSYDLLVAGYFNDMFQVLQDVFRVLRRGKTAVFVLGDSAPYGIHIPTDELIGKLGVAIGFSDYQIQVLRSRGGKWKDNPQRHTVQLRESVVTLKKH